MEQAPPLRRGKDKRPPEADPRLTDPSPEVRAQAEAAAGLPAFLGNWFFHREPQSGGDGKGGADGKSTLPAFLRNKLRRRERERGKEKGKRKGKDKKDKGVKAGKDAHHKKDKHKGAAGPGADEKQALKKGGGPAGKKAGGAGGALQAPKVSEVDALEFPALPPVPVPWMGLPPMPVIEGPPAAVLKREHLIQVETGLPPIVHHDRVRFTIGELERVALAAQQEIIRFVAGTADQTAESITRLAGQIPGAAGAAEKWLDGQITKAAGDIRKAYQDASKIVDAFKLDRSQDLDAKREEVNKQIFEELAKAGDEVADYDKKLQTAFDNYKGKAGGFVEAIPDLAKGGKPKNVAKGDGAAVGSVAIADTLDNVQSATDGELASSWASQQTRYENQEIRWQLKDLFEAQKKKLQEAAKNRAKYLQSDAVKTQFREYSFGLFAVPTEKTKSDEKGKDTATQKDQVNKEQKEFASAKEQVLDDLKTRGEDAAKRVEEQEGPKLKKSIRESGAKMYAAMKGQAKQIRNQLAGLAAPLADSYQDLARRVPALVPPKQFLDVRTVLPQLRALIDAAKAIREGHLDQVGKQAEEAVKSVGDSLPEQLQSLHDQAKDQAESTNTYFVTPAQFDFGMAAVKFTGVMNDGVKGTMAAAKNFIKKVVAQKKKEAKDDKKYADELEDSAIKFLNDNIKNSVDAHNKAVSGTKEEFEQTKFPEIRRAADGIIEPGAHKVEHAVPHRSTAGLVFGTILSPIGGAIYAYATRSSASDVWTALGEYKFPSARAIEEWFNANISGDSMQTRIRDRLSEADANHAIDLLSESAKTRIGARQAIAEDTYKTFGGTREAREAVLKGASSEEKISDPATIKKMSDQMVDELSGSKLKIAQAYLDNSPEGPGRVLAARMEESFNKGIKQNDDDIVTRLDAVAQMAKKEQNTAYVSQKQLDDTTRNAIIQYAINTGKFQGTFEQLAQKPEVAAELFTRSVTAARAVVPTMIGDITAAKIDLTGLDKKVVEQKIKDAGGKLDTVDPKVVAYVRKFADASLEKDPDKRQQLSNELWAMRGGYEMRRAEAESGSLSNNQTTRLSGALQDDQYFNMKRRFDEATEAEKIDLAPQLKKAEEEHEKKLALLAGNLTEKDPKAKAEMDAAGGPHEYLARRASKQFAREGVRAEFSRAWDIARGRDDGPTPYQYGRELIDLGRPKLLTQVMLASRGSTNDDLLRAAYANRSHKEIAEATKQYATMTGGEDIEVMLGIRHKPRTAAEMKELGIKPPQPKSTAEQALEAAGWVASPVGMLLVSGPKTSGDLSMELERLAKGNPENDRDYAEIAALQHEQERDRGTGFIAKHTMAGTSEQVVLDQRKQQLAEMICDAGGYDRKYASQVFGPGGDIQEPFRRNAFDEKGNLKVKEGDTSTRISFMDQIVGVQRAADSYRTEIDRQESLMTSIISALAIVAAVVLAATGVGAVLSGVIIAVVAGAATMIVKAGMRGERYGHDEMMMDLAMTAIEAGTAALGGKLASGLAKGAAARGALAKIGVALEQRLGKVGGAVAREAIVGFTSNAAKAAIQPGVWDDGIGAGLGRVFGAGFRGAAISGITAGVSTAISAKLGKALEPKLIDPEKATALQKLATRLGPAGSEIVRETVANTAGALSGSMFNILIDVASGDFHGGLRDALEELGTTAAREIFTNMARAVGSIRNREHYEQLMAKARARGDISEADLKVLKAAAVSAGKAHHDDDISSMRHEVEAGRAALEGVPPSLKPMVAGYSAEEIARIKSSLASPELGTPQERLAMVRQLVKTPGADGELVARQLEEVRAEKVAAAQAVEATRARGSQVRAAVAAELEGPARRAVKDLPVEGLDRLPAAELKRAAAMIAKGEIDPQAARDLYRAARRNDPELDEATFQRSLNGAAEKAAQVHKEEAVAAARRAPPPDDAAAAAKRPARLEEAAARPEAARPAEPRPEARAPTAAVETARAPQVTAEVAARPVVAEQAEAMAHAQVPTTHARETIGWAGEPGAGAPHTERVAGGLAHLDQVAPGVRAQLDELVHPPISAEHQSQLDALSRRQQAIVAELQTLSAGPKAAGPEAAARRKVLAEELSTVQAEHATVSQRAEEARQARVSANQEQAEYLMAQLRKSLFTPSAEGEAVARPTREIPLPEIDPSALASIARNRPEGVEAFKQDLAAFVRLTGQDISHLTIIATAEGPRFLHDTNQVDIGNFPGRSTVFHELAHSLEYLHPEIAEATRSFLEARAAGAEHPAHGGDYTTPTPLPGEHRAGQVGFLGDFITPYTGRVYPGAPSTEVITTAIERFDSPRRMLELYQHDPEHFAFVVGVFQATRAQAAAIGSAESAEAAVRVTPPRRGPPTAPEQAEIAHKDRVDAQVRQLLADVPAHVFGPTPQLSGNVLSIDVGAGKLPLLVKIETAPPEPGDHPPAARSVHDQTGNEVVIQISHGAPLAEIERALAHEIVEIRARATAPELQRLAELQRIQKGPAGVIRPGTELSNDDVVHSLNEQLLPVKPQEVDRIIASFPVDQRDAARLVLAKASGYANMESLNIVRQAIEDHIEVQPDPSQPPFRRKLYTPGRGSLADNIEYCNNEKQAFDAVVSPGKIKITDPRGELEPHAIVILDKVVLDQIRTTPGFAAELIAKNCLLLDPVGLESGINMFNAVSSTAIARRTGDLLQRSHEIHRSFAGTVSFEEAVTMALREPMRQTLHAADPRLMRMVEPVDAAGHVDLSSDALSRVLTGATGITRTDLEAAFGTMSEKGRSYARELLARQGEVYSPRAFARMLAQHQQHLMTVAAQRGVAPEDVYFFIYKPKKSYGMIAMAHRDVTDTDSDHYINGPEDLRRLVASGKLHDRTMVVVLDDVAGSGASQGEAVDSGGIKTTPYAGHIIASPLLSTERAKNLFVGANGLTSRIPRLAFEPRTVTQVFTESAFYKGLSTQQRADLEKVIQGLGYDRNALSMAFPYMSPDNNNAFFVDRMAHFFIFNRNENAVKHINAPWVVPSL
ncbi:MAG TPA: hypothetical protein VFF06_29890 [Polyangia bacterium]|nr:hypothetical protein [Polyangia bacterium]